jgi:hypothetical protein
LLLAGLAVSTFALDFFLLEGGAEGFLPARDFFSIGIAVSPDDFKITVRIASLKRHCANYHKPNRRQQQRAIAAFPNAD